MALVEHGGELALPIIRALTDPALHVRWKAQAHMQAQGVQALPALRDAALHAAPHVQLACVDLLATLDDADARATLRHLAQHASDAAVRAAAVAVLPI